MVDLEQFKANAQSHGICEMLEDWNNAKSKKQLMDVALSIRGIEYLAIAIAQGWGISPEVIVRDFPMFINGKYIRNDKYTSAIYCRPPEDKIEITTTAALIIGYDGIVTIPKNHICELYLCQSKVQIQGEGKGVAYKYDSVISNPDTAPVVVKEDKHYGTI